MSNNGPDDLRVIGSAELSADQQDQVVDIYAQAFPPELRVPFAELANPGPAGLMHLALDGSEPVGFAASMLLGDTGWTFLRYYAISATRRGRGVGRRFWPLLLTALESEAWPVRVVFEVEDPGQAGADPAEKGVRDARIAFWERCGARLLPVDAYVMPDLVGLAAPEPMRLMAYDAATGGQLVPGQVADLVAALYSCRYGLASDHPMVLAALASVKK
jgi:GNAT superfamily N-acetyltransferase